MITRLGNEMLALVCFKVSLSEMLKWFCIIDLKKSPSSQVYASDLRRTYFSELVVSYLTFKK